jgi:hypothetical protein
MVELVEVAPGLWRVKKPVVPAARSALPLPYLISDTMEPTEQVDGRYYTSKSAFRAVGRAHGLTEVGNEKMKPKQRATLSTQVKTERREAIKAAIEQVKAGNSRK